MKIPQSQSNAWSSKLVAHFHQGDMRLWLAHFKCTSKHKYVKRWPWDSLYACKIESGWKLIILKYCIAKVTMIKCTSDSKVPFLMKTKEELQIFSNNSIHTWN